MEGSVLSFLKAEWKVSDTGSVSIYRHEYLCVRDCGKIKKVFKYIYIRMRCLFRWPFLIVHDLKAIKRKVKPISTKLSPQIIEHEKKKPWHMTLENWVLAWDSNKNVYMYLCLSLKSLMGIPKKNCIQSLDIYIHDFQYGRRQNYAWSHDCKCKSLLTLKIAYHP